MKQSSDKEKKKRREKKERRDKKEKKQSWTKTSGDDIKFFIETAND